MRFALNKKISAVSALLVMLAVLFAVPAFAMDFAELKGLALSGDAGAQNDLGLAYIEDDDVPTNYYEGVSWLRKAADQGLALAQHNLGLMYYDGGQGVPRDKCEAARWVKMAAEQGLAEAQYNLAVMYFDGEGVEQSYANAMKWYHRAAAKNYANAQYNLGVIYQDGNGVPQDYSASLKWYHRAAKQGLAEAQYNLGLMYVNGLGVPEKSEGLNYVEGVSWLKKAAAQGDFDAINVLHELGEDCVAHEKCKK